MHTSTPHIDPGTADQLMPVPEAAQLLAVHISTIRRWIRQGKLPAYRVGDKGIRVRYGDVMQLLTPLSIEEEDAGPAGHRSPGLSGLTPEEQRRARAAAASARTLQEELRVKYGAMTPESWELLNESRDERTTDLTHTAKT